MPVASDDTLEVFRWSVRDGSQPLGRMVRWTEQDPEDGVDDVGPGGLLYWTPGEVEGELVPRTPRVLRPDGSTGALGPSREDAYARLAWLPPESAEGAAAPPLAVVNHGPQVSFLRTAPGAAGTTVRTVSAARDTTGVVLGLAVHSADGRVAAAVLEHAYREDAAAAGDLVVLDRTGRPQARLAGVLPVRRSDGFYLPVPLHWLPDGRILFARPTADPRAGDGAGGEPTRLVLADPATTRIDSTDVFNPEVRGVSRAGAVLLAPARVFDARRGTVDSLPWVEGEELRPTSISPDGRWISGWVPRDDGAQVFGLLDRRSGGWRVLGRGFALGWMPDGAFLWAAFGTSPGRH
ncbi:MAG TPA: hypothetical protein VFS40_12255 [Gemmatimonadales bacterium]|nr:hypothetical protein [Gemmatimonadales bacterium]